MQEAQAYSATLIEDPQAFEDNYTLHEEKPQVQASQPQKKESRFIQNMKNKAERRNLEQNAAWERMEAIENKRDGKGEKEELKFVTGHYRKQLELQKQNDADIATQEEKQNEKRKGEEGMIGFYSKLMTGNKALGNAQAEKPKQAKVQPKQDFNSIMQLKLNELKQKQQQTQAEAAKTNLKEDDTLLSMQGKPSRKRSRSRDREPEPQKPIEAKANHRENEKQAKLAKIAAMKARFKSRKEQQVDQDELNSE